jgi:hypothetical protein
MTGTGYHAQLFSIEMGSHKLLPFWPENMILLISASQVARITGMGHCHQLRIDNLIFSRT